MLIRREYYETISQILKLENNNSWFTRMHAISVFKTDAHFSLGVESVNTTYVYLWLRPVLRPVLRSE